MNNNYHRLEKPNFHNRRSQTCGQKTPYNHCLKGRTKLKSCPFGQYRGRYIRTANCATLVCGYENSALSGYKNHDNQNNHIKITVQTTI
jgi:hypothetical protein